MLSGSALAASDGSSCNNTSSAGTTGSQQSAGTGNGGPSGGTENTVGGDIVKCAGFGIGIGGFFFAKPDITSAVVRGGVVRILEEHHREASAWFELHTTPFELSVLGHNNINWGPFVATQLGSTNGNFNSFAVGAMFNIPATQGSNVSFGLGLGYGWTQIHQLGDGFVENQAPPPGEAAPSIDATTVRLKQTDIGGPVVMLSVSYSPK
jgi:hypothetical protein